MTEQSIVESRDIKVIVGDGEALEATLFTAQGSNRVVIINSATAVPRYFYHSFANKLCQAGYTTITFDYRGINGSRPDSLKGFSASIQDWVFLDMSGVLAWAKSTLSPDKIFVVGHSVGGQLIGMLDNAADIDGLITVCANNGYWRLLKKGQRFIICFHAYVTMPVLSTLFGYMPWGWFGAMDLPKGVALEWASWCRKPRYLLDDLSLPIERFSQFEAPVIAYSFEDDPWGTKIAVDAMMSVYSHVERRHIFPANNGLSTIGHLGFFRKRSSQLWEETIAWLNTI